MILSRVSVLDGQIPPNFDYPTRSLVNKEQEKGSIQFDLVFDKNQKVLSKFIYILLYV
jgi:hypothetical protein